MANKIEIRDARISGRNFTGREKRRNGRVVNSEGNRNFLLVIPDDMVQELLDEGFNVKQFLPDENGNPGDYYIQVKVGFAYKPPVIWLVTDKNGKKVRSKLEEEDVSILDDVAYADIREIKVVVRPVSRKDENTGETRITPYLELLYFEMDNTDPFEDDYNFED